MFLFEDGRAGVISHIDFVVNPQTSDKLNDLDNMTKKLSALKLGETYLNSENDANSSSDQLEKLSIKLRSLQADLLKAQDDKKRSIEVQISVVQAQILMMADI